MEERAAVTATRRREPPHAAGTFHLCAADDPGRAGGRWVAMGVERWSVSDSTYNHGHGVTHRAEQSEAGSGTELSPRWESAPVTPHCHGVWRGVNIGAV